MGYYNTTIQNKLQQTLDNATTSGSIAGTKAVTLTMSPSFGTYRTLSNRNFILWFFTGGVNCTSFAEWLSSSRGTTCGMSNPTQMTQTYATSVNTSNIPVDYRSTVPYDNQRVVGDGDQMEIESGGGGSPKRRKYKHKKRRKQKTKRRRKRKTKRKRRGKKRKTRIKRKARIKKKTRRRR